MESSGKVQNRDVWDENLRAWGFTMYLFPPAWFSPWFFGFASGVPEHSAWNSAWERGNGGWLQDLQEELKDSLLDSSGWWMVDGKIIYIYIYLFIHIYIYRDYRGCSGYLSNHQVAFISQIPQTRTAHGPGEIGELLWRWLRPDWWLASFFGISMDSRYVGNHISHTYRSHKQSLTHTHSLTDTLFTIVSISRLSRWDNVGFEFLNLEWGLAKAPIDPATLRGHDRSGEKCAKETRVMHTSTHRI